jgi:phenylalanyl-tRNA synthetase beta chain
MRISVNWLREYVDFDFSPVELGERLTMAGAEVEEIIEIGEGLEHVVVGLVEDVKPHPNADRLVLCTVDIGRMSPLQVVCGAPNVRQGIKVALALPGAKLPGGIEILKTRLRGEVSEGMLCSMKELGLGEDSDGIMILPDGLIPGKGLVDALGIRDTIIDLSITPNRPDCLSMLGIAREVSAITGNPLRIPECDIQNTENDVADLTSVQVLEPELAPRYAARVITGVKVGPSPQWLQERVKAAGMRPINNIVDITNFVMMEYGQPLHAFDYNKLFENRIVVRRAAQGEKLVSIDGQERILSDDMLVIADGKEPVAVAGVMGGFHSEVSESTTSILLESANFQRVTVRRTSRKLGMRTEASNRFEKGLAPEQVIPALDRAAYLIQEMAGGQVARGICDIWDGPGLTPSIEIDPKRINKLLGSDIPHQEMVQILQRLGFQVHGKATSQVLRVDVPYFRNDVTGEADIIEEILRIYGFDKIEATLPHAGGVQGGMSQRYILQDKIRRILIGCGLNEILTYSFISPKVWDLLGLPEDDPRRRAITIRNPLSEEQSVMRTSLIPGLMDVIVRNINRGAQDLRIFEVGASFIPEELPLHALPTEPLTLAMALSGFRTPLSWNTKREEMDFYDLKGILEVLLDNLGVEDAQVSTSDDMVFLHPTRQGSIVVGGERIGLIGEVHPDVLERYGLKQAIQIMEMNLEPLLKPLPRQTRKYRGLPRFPAVQRDIAMIADKGIPAKDIQAVIETSGGALVEKVILFDSYSGKQIPERKRSLAYSITYRAKDRTLTDEEVNQIHNKVIEALVTDLAVEIRK